MKEGVKDEAARMKVIMADILALLDKEKEKKGDEVVLDSDAEDALLDEMEELRDIVEQIDMAGVFAKFGGCTCLLSLLKAAALPVSVRAMAASVIGTLAQNNIAVQEAMHKQGKPGINYIRSRYSLSLFVCRLFRFFASSLWLILISLIFLFLYFLPILLNFCLFSLPFRFLRHPFSSFFSSLKLLFHILPFIR